MSSLITINADEYTLSDLPVFPEKPKARDHQMDLFGLLMWPRLSYVKCVFAQADKSYFAI